MLALEGALDLETAPQATEAFLEFLQEHGPYVILDTSHLDFVDSKGVGMLISAAKAARDAGGQLFMNNPAIPVQKILEMCGLTSLFPPRPRPEPAPALPTEKPEAAGVAAASGRAPRTPRRAA